LEEALGHCEGDACLEMGFGSGAALASVSGRFGLAVGTDILGIQEAKLGRDPLVELVLADRARCFRDGVFDLVFFNPPYLPSARVEDQAVDGGRGGIEVPFSFLEEALRVLKAEGSIMVLLSDKGDLGSFLSRSAGLGLMAELAAERRLFFERLAVFRFKRATGAAARSPSC
jgi:release factor glutamine methyltransferase